MAQFLKDEVRTKILRSAEQLFVSVGFKKATMAGIAKEAGMAVGNIYKYYPNKDELFAAILTDEFVEKFQKFTLDRVSVLNDPSKETEIITLEEDAAAKLLQFWIANRHKTIILLSKSEGSKYEDFFQEYVQLMIDFSMSLIHHQRPELDINGMFKFVFRNRVEETVRDAILILEEYSAEKDIYDAFAVSWIYHNAGVQALIKSLSKTA